MKSALFLLGLQRILIFCFKTNCNNLNLDCFYVLPDYPGSKPFGGLVNLLTLLVPLSRKINAKFLPLHVWVYPDK